jgi:hypothetical protein
MKQREPRMHEGSTRALSLHLGRVITYDCEPAQLQQLSAMEHLADLELRELASEGLPGGLPSQLTKLTRLHVMYSRVDSCSLAEQLQHLSSLTALRDLTVGCNDYRAAVSSDDLSGLQRLPLLTRLSLSCHGMPFSTASTRSWGLTALEAVSLSGCTMQPDALAAFTQLRALSLQDILTEGCEALLLAVSLLPHLTELCIAAVRCTRAPPPAAAACTALTLGTNLCALQLGLEHTVFPYGCDLFRQPKV